MLRLLLLAISTAAALTCLSQDTTKVTNNKSYTARISLLQASKLLDKGYLTLVTDSGFLISNKSIPYGITVESRHVDVAGVDRIVLKRKGAAVRGLVIGSGSGALAGLLLGFIEGDDPPGSWWHSSAGEKAFAYGLTFGLGGGLIGLVAGAISQKTYRINRNRENLRIVQAGLLRKIN